jgi:5-methylthioadenosine/S-adenosylhomocysteine deaminase
MTTILIKGGLLVTGGGAAEWPRRGDVLVRNGLIAELGGEIAAPEDATIMDASDRIVMPGFVDSHTHLWNSLWRTASASYMRVHDTLGAHYRPEDSAVGVRLAVTEMINSGTTTVHAWEHNCRSADHVEAEIEAIGASGIRAHYSYGYHHDSDTNVPTDFRPITDVRDRWTGDLMTVGFASRGVGTHKPGANPFPTLPPHLRRRESDEARSLGLRITYHVGPFGSPPETYIDLAGPDVLYAHGYQWEPDTWKALADRGAAMSMSPYAASGYRMLPPLADMDAAGVTVSLSVDQLGGPGSADMFRVVQLAHEMTRLAGKEVTPQRLLDFATLEGARALGLEKVTGSLAVGKAADIILVRTDVLGMTPLVDPFLALVNSARPDYVSDVLVGGTILKRNGQLVGIDLAQVREESTQTLSELLERSGVDPIRRAS